MSKKRPIPNFGQPIIETHCHLDYLKQASTAEIVEHAHSVGVERIITISVEPDNLDGVRRLVREHEHVFGTQGVHPHEASKFDEDAAGRIVAGLAEEKILAVGEIGLDYHYEHSPRQVQREVFARQLRIAIEHQRPIVVHTREADADTIDILGEYAADLARKGVIHSFTSSPELAEFCLQAGFHLGFNGIITFNKAENVREVLALAPLDRILLETDAPFLTPVPYRGKENAPFYIPFVAERAAEVKQVSLEQLLAQAYQNSLDVFFS